MFRFHPISPPTSFQPCLTTFSLKHYLHDWHVCDLDFFLTPWQLLGLISTHLFILTIWNWGSLSFKIRATFPLTLLSPGKYNVGHDIVYQNRQKSQSPTQTTPPSSRMTWQFYSGVSTSHQTKLIQTEIVISTSPGISWPKGWHSTGQIFWIILILAFPLSNLSSSPLDIHPKLLQAASVSSWDYWYRSVSVSPAMCRYTSQYIFYAAFYSIF